MSDIHRPDEPDYEAVHRYVEVNLKEAKRRQRRALLRLHCLLYLIANLIGWIIITAPVLGSLSPYDLPFYFYHMEFLGGLVTIIWGVGLFLHARALHLESPEGERHLRARLVVEAMQNRTAAESPKLKREQIMRLADDGEFAPDGRLDTELQYRARSES